LKFLKQELEKKDKKLAKLREKREKIKAIKAKEPKQLSKKKFEPLDLEFNLGEDIKGNLRGIKPEGNILEDRYKSLQRRNIIEPTVKQRYISYRCISVLSSFKRHEMYHTYFINVCCCCMSHSK
jgi:nucleolar protein 53